MPSDDIRNSTAAGTEVGREIGREAAGLIQIDINAVAEYAGMLHGIGTLLDSIRTGMQEPGVASVVNELPNGYFRWRYVADSLTEAADAFRTTSAHTTAIAYLFAEVDASYMGQGIPRRVWESYLAQRREADGAGWLDRVDDILATPVAGTVSVDQAARIRDILSIPANATAFAGGMTMASLNRQFARFDDLPTKVAKRERAALIRQLLGEYRRGDAALANAIAKQFAKNGSFESPAELLGRLEEAGQISPAQAERLYQALNTGGFGRIRLTAADIRATSRRLGTATVAAAYMAVYIRGGRVAGAADLATHLGARGAARMQALRTIVNTRLMAATSGEALAARLGRRLVVAGLGTAVEVVLLPVSIVDFATADTKLGRASAGMGAAAGGLAITAVATSWTGVGGLGAGTLAGGAALISLGLAGADAVNQHFRHQEQNEAFIKAAEAAAEKAYRDELDRQTEAALAEMAAQARRVAPRRVRAGSTHDTRAQLTARLVARSSATPVAA